jgi:hypothetical protein
MKFSVNLVLEPPDTSVTFVTFVNVSLVPIVVGACKDPNTSLVRFSV